MLTLTSCSVKFYTRFDRKNRDGAHSIWVRVIVNRRKTELHTFEYIDKDKWNPKTGRAKGATRDDNNLNLRLASIEAKVFALRDTMERAGKQCSVLDVRSMLKEGSKPNDMTFLEFFKKHIGKIKQNPNEYGPTVIVQYQTTMVHFTAYLDSIRNRHLLLRELSINNLVGFEEFLLTEYVNPTLGRKMLRSTSNKYLSRIRTVCGAAVRSGAIDKSPFQMGFKLKGTKSNREALSLEEVDIIRNHSLGNNPALDRARDIFIWECYTGMRWSDGQALKAEDVKFDKKSDRYWVIIRQRKTGEILELPLFSIPVGLYHKYQQYRETTGYVLPRLSNQKVNSYMRVIGDLTGITKKLTSHIGRHTFATTILQQEAEIDIATVSKMLGHTSLKSTAIYARVSRQLLANTAAKVDKKQMPNVTKPTIYLN